MFTAIIIDDEPNARKYLFNLIQQYFSNQVHVIDLASNVKDAVGLIQTFHPDIVFLDIEMPGGNGFDLYKHFDNGTNFDVIITTAHKDYAISAIKNGAFDYLLKPIDQVDLMSLLKKLDKKKQSNLNNQNITQNYSENLPKIAFSTLYGIKYLELYSIIYANADGAYTEIHTVDGKTITSTKSLKEFEELTKNHNFFRSHKSYVVNLAYVSELIKKDEYQIVMKNNMRIPLSIRKRDEFESKFI